MSQHDYDIANADGATVRADLNALFEALASQNAGSTAPSVTFQFMPWMDTANNLLKIRNAANNAWVTVASLASGVWIPYRNGVALPAFGATVGDLLQIVGVGSPAVAGLPAIDGSQLTGISSVAAGNRVLIASNVAAASASLEFVTGIDSTYDVYRFEITNLYPATDGTTLLVTVSDDVGSTWKSSTYYYGVNGRTSAAGALDAAGANAASFPIVSNAINGAQFNGVNGWLEIYNPDMSSSTNMNWHLMHTLASGAAGFVVGGGSYQNSTGVINGVKFAAGSGNLTAGTINLYGIKK